MRFSRERGRKGGALRLPRPSHPPPVPRPGTHLREPTRGGLRPGPFLGARTAHALVACGLVLSVATAAGFLGRLSWMLDLASHFRVQYSVLLAAIALLLWAARHPRWAALFGAFGAADLALVLPIFVAGARTAPAEASRVRVALLNVLTSNTRYEDALAEIRRLDPDLFVALETDSRWLERLEQLSTAYPYSIADARPDNFGIALFSRLPLDRTRIVHLGRAGLPSVLAELRVEGTRLAVLGTHVVPPVGASAAALRDDQLEEIALFAAHDPGPLLVLGDLNCTPWSVAFRALRRTSGLGDGRRGIDATWPAALGWLGIPIDHVLHSPGLTALARGVGRSIGSDHRPLVAEFALGAP